MDSTRMVLLVFIVAFLLPHVSSSSSSSGVFKLHHKFGNQHRSLAALKAHDAHRHRRILASLDLPLGGNGRPTGSGLYYTKLGLGSPPKDFHVHVDTGSDVFWVNGAQCASCKKKTGLDGLDLAFYDPKESATGKVVNCGDDRCSLMFGRGYDPQCAINNLCQYTMRYADGTQNEGYYVNDYIYFNQVSGNVTSLGNSSIVFGCGVKQSGEPPGNEAIDGIIGFGQANSSVLSQLASVGKVKRVFSHCLDGQQGGGIFAIGQVVEPKVKSTPLVPKQTHYTVNLKGIEVGKTTLQLPTDIFEIGDMRGTVIDSGSTLAYFPAVVYNPLMRTILSHQPELSVQVVEDQFQCVEYSGSVDDGFPTVTLHFEDSVPLKVYPREYMFNTIVQQRELWCMGWLNGGFQNSDWKYMTVLGDIVLSNKLVVYDLENQVIGWAEHNCSSSIKLLDGPSGAEDSIGAHDLSSSPPPRIHDIRRVLILLLLCTMLHVTFF